MTPLSNKKMHERFSPLAWLILIVVSVFYISINYAGTEGLCPSNDGIVLAQSWRIIQGEIPHLEFISIRPAASAFLHTINFALPFPLETSARYAVLFQFFIIAFSWMQFFRLKSKFKHEIPNIYKISLLLIAWISSIYNYHLFPWPIIDAVFWSSLGFYIIERSFHVNRPVPGLSLGLMALILAALSQQAFVVVAGAGWIWALLRIYKKRDWKTGIISVCISIIPLVLYGIMIAANDAGRAFLSQISGPLHHYKPAIANYLTQFEATNIKWVHILILCLSVIIGIVSRLSGKLHTFLATLPAMRIIFLVETALVLYLLYDISDYFINSTSWDIAHLPFMAFWILFDLLVINVLVQRNKFNMCQPAWFGLLIAGISSISIPDQTPVFSFGILIISILYLYLIKYQDALLLKQNWLKVALPAIALLFCISGTYSQFRINYHDIAKSKQTHNLGSINEAYGNTHTNEYTWQYFNEVDSLVKSFAKKEKPFVFLPDNAIVYPVYRISNPLPVDRTHKTVLAGQKERFNKELIWKIDEGALFLIQKHDVKTMYNGFEKLNYDQYGYLQTIFTECELLDETRHFKIYSKYMLH